MIAAPIALTDAGQTMWYVALGMGLVVVLVVAALMTLLLSFVKDIQTSVGVLLELAGQVATQTEHIPQLEALPPVLEQIVEEAVVQNSYMDALTQGYASESG